MNRIILDPVEGISIDADSPPVLNYQALGYLPDGLLLLANSVRGQEIQVMQQHGGALDLLMPGGRLASMMANWFNWFSISLISYLRLVRLLGLMEEKGWRTEDLKEGDNRKILKSVCIDYIRCVVPEIYLWRNKIAAHPAFTDPVVLDSIGTLELSIMAPIAYHRPYFRAGRMQWDSGAGPSNLDLWALTEIFEKLAPRFWPTKLLAAIPAVNKAPVV